MQDNKEKLAQVFCDVLMNYAFMFGDESPKDELPNNGAVFLHATVGFRGHRKGTLGILTSDGLCNELAANVLGLELEEGISENDASDALKELINVVCGQFLTEIFGEEPIFDLLPPSVSQIDEITWRELVDNGNALGFMVEDAPVITYMSFSPD